MEFVGVVQMRLIRSFSPEAEALTGFKKSARCQRVIDGLLPPPISLGDGRASAFISDELEAIIAARANGANDAEVRDLVKRLVAARQTKQFKAA